MLKRWNTVRELLITVSIHQGSFKTSQFTRQNKRSTHTMLHFDEVFPFPLATKQSGSNSERFWTTITPITYKHFPFRRASRNVH